MHDRFRGHRRCAAILGARPSRPPLTVRRALVHVGAGLGPRRTRPAAVPTVVRSESGGAGTDRRASASATAKSGPRNRSCTRSRAGASVGRWAFGGMRWLAGSGGELPQSGARLARSGAERAMHPGGGSRQVAASGGAGDGCGGCRRQAHSSPARRAGSGGWSPERPRQVPRRRADPHPHPHSRSPRPACGIDRRPRRPRSLPIAAPDRRSRSPVPFWTPDGGPRGQCRFGDAGGNARVPVPSNRLDVPSPRLRPQTPHPLSISGHHPALHPQSSHLRGAGERTGSRARDSLTP